MEDIRKRAEEKRDTGLYLELPLAELEKMRLGERGEVSIQEPLVDREPASTTDARTTSRFQPR